LRAHPVSGWPGDLPVRSAPVPDDRLSDREVLAVPGEVRHRGMEVEVADALVALALGATDDPVGDLPHPSGELPQTLSRELHGLPREADEVRGVRVVDDDTLGALGERLHGESHR